MARIRLHIENDSGNPQPLPDLLGGYDVPDGGTETILADPGNLKRLEREDKPNVLQELERLEDTAGVTVAIVPDVHDEADTLEEQLEEAVALASGRSSSRKVVPVGDEVAKNAGGVEYSGDQYAEGRVVAKDPEDDQHHPVINGAVASGVSNTNTIPVEDASQYESEQWVEIPSVSDGADRFRKITGVDEGAGEITIGGSSISPSEGDALIVDPSRAHDTVESASGSGSTIDVVEASKFEAGQRVDIGPPSYKFVFDVTGNTDGDYAINLYLDPDESTGLFISFANAFFAASANSVGTIATALKDALTDQLPLASVSTQNTSEIHVDLASYAPIDEWQFGTQDPSGEINLLTGSWDFSKGATISSVDEANNTITFDWNLTWANGEKVVTHPAEAHEVVDRRIGDEAVVKRFAAVDEADLDGLTDHARRVLEENRQLIVE